MGPKKREMVIFKKKMVYKTFSFSLKNLCKIFIIILFLNIFFIPLFSLVNAQIPIALHKHYIIAGRVYESDGSLAIESNVTITNLNTSDKLYLITQQGEFVEDLANFYSDISNDDQITIAAEKNNRFGTINLIVNLSSWGQEVNISLNQTPTPTLTPSPTPTLTPSPTPTLTPSPTPTLTPSPTPTLTPSPTPTLTPSLTPTLTPTSTATPSCKKGYKDCYPPWDDCETNIYDDNYNCGDCGNRCPEGYFCLLGSCVENTTANKEKLASYYLEQCQIYKGEKRYDDEKNYLLKAKDVYIDINRPDKVLEIAALIEETEDKIRKREIFELIFEIPVAVILAVIFGYIFERGRKKVSLWIVVISSALVFFIIFLALRLWIIPLFY